MDLKIKLEISYLIKIKIYILIYKMMILKIYCIKIIRILIKFYGNKFNFFRKI